MCNAVGEVWNYFDFFLLSLHNRSPEADGPFVGYLQVIASVFEMVLASNLSIINPAIRINN